MNKLELGKDQNSLIGAGRAYGDQLVVFKDQHGLPDELFAKPDHMAVKCADAEHYQVVVEAAREYSGEIYEVMLNGRRLASAALLGPVAIGNFGSVQWIEIMEPRPERVGNDVIGLDHAEFYVQELGAAASLLSQKGIPFEREKNPSHEWLSAKLGPKGPEIKLTGRQLVDIVGYELEQQTAKTIWPARNIIATNKRKEQ